MGEVLIPLRHCWRDAFSVFAFALLSFWSLDALFVFGLPPCRKALGLLTRGNFFWVFTAFWVLFKRKGWRCGLRCSDLFLRKMAQLYQKAILLQV